MLSTLAFAEYYLFMAFNIHLHQVDTIDILLADNGLNGNILGGIMSFNRRTRYESTVAGNAKWIAMVRFQQSLEGR